MKIRNHLYIGYGIIILILISIVFIANYHSSNLIDATDRVIHSEKVIVKINRIKTHLSDAETGQRGYIITKKSSYLEPYYVALNSLQRDINQLRDLTSNNPNQQEMINRLEPLIKDKLNELKETIDLQQANRDTEAREIILSNKGKIIMVDIRVLLTQMQNEEKRILSIHSLEPEEQRKKTKNFLILVVTLATIFCAAIAIINAKLISKPIITITQIVDKITKGKLDIQLPKSNIYEVENLTSSLNRILVSLKLAVLRTGLSKESIGIGFRPQPKKTTKSKKK